MPDIPCRDAADAGELSLQVVSQPFDDSLAPAFGLLTIHDGAADVPVQVDQLAVDRQSGPMTRALREGVTYVLGSREATG